MVELLIDKYMVQSQYTMFWSPPAPPNSFQFIHDRLFFRKIIFISFEIIQCLVSLRKFLGQTLHFNSDQGVERCGFVAERRGQDMQATGLGAAANDRLYPCVRMRCMQTLQRGGEGVQKSYTYLNIYYRDICRRTACLNLTVKTLK